MPIMLGGSHVSASPLTALNDPDVDFIIRGEGERPFVEFLKAFQSGAPLDRSRTWVSREKGAPVLNPLEENYGLDELPLADLSDLPVTGRYLVDEATPLLSIHLQELPPPVHILLGTPHLRKRISYAFGAQYHL